MCVSVGDGRMGHPEEAPYDAIHVGAAAPIVPQAVSFSEYLRADDRGHIMALHFQPRDEHKRLQRKLM